MLPADILLVDDLQVRSIPPVRSVLVWMEELDLIIETGAQWPVDHRLQFTIFLDGKAASGMIEVRAWRSQGEARLVRCQIVRIAPEDAAQLSRWQAQLAPVDAPLLFEDAPTTSVSVRRGRDAFNDALRDRIRRLRETRLV
ncbi:MAG: hypothetical protein ACI8RZ_001116 [Myxococcota bacterium]|jgi:hypothetical protein